jgi:mRNA interferase YafQ
MLLLKYAHRRKRDLKLIIKRGKDAEKLIYALDTLARELRLPPEYNDHKLNGQLKAYRECHIELDWTLIYKIDWKAWS